MSAVVIPRFTVHCEEHGSTIRGIATQGDAEWVAAEHNRALHATHTAVPVEEER